MTSGEKRGTSGWARDQWAPWLAVALVGAAIVVVNSTSDILEFARADVDIGWWEPVVWELSSAIVIVAMAPLIGRAMRRWPPRANGLLRFGLIHLALTIPFALAHVAAIYVMRSAVYALVGGRYGFFDDGVGIVLLYEWRKDALVYAAIAGVYWMFGYIAERRQAVTAAPSEDRIEIRDGGAAVFFAPADILVVEAAGNYVEFNLSDRTHLVRGTLASWEARLAARGFLRVHRSRLVNRSRIRALKPTPSGDVDITLDDGRTVLGSRRYRAALENPSQQV